LNGVQVKIVEHCPQSLSALALNGKGLSLLFRFPRFIEKIPLCLLYALPQRLSERAAGGIQGYTQ